MKSSFTRFLCFVVCLLSTLPSHCQSKYTYIINLAGDTIFTDLKYSSKLHINNKEIIAKENGRYTRFLPNQLKGYFNGEDVYESRTINGVSAFLLRKITGHLNLYLCDETIAGQMVEIGKPADAIIVSNALTGGVVGGLVTAAVVNAATQAVHLPKIPIVGHSEGALKVFNPNHSKKQRLLELRIYFGNEPEIQAIIEREPFNLEIYLDAVTTYNRLQESEIKLGQADDKTKDGF